MQLSVLLENFLELEEKLSSNSKLFRPTEIFNEGWLLRFILDWFSSNRQNTEAHQLHFYKDAKWFSEAYLPSPFMKGKDKETRTHADGVIGHFEIGEKGKADLRLTKDATQFIAIEAKLMSKLSAGVKADINYDQVSRYIGCIYYLLEKAERFTGSLDEMLLCFYLVAPKGKEDMHSELLKRASIKLKITERAKKLKRELNNLDRLFANIKVEFISWEDLIKFIQGIDNRNGYIFNDYYDCCLRFNGVNANNNSSR